MSGKFVRASKYRHVFGQKAKKEASYENLKISTNAFDANLIKANSKYLGSCWQASGGGAFAVIPLSEVGKAPDLVPLFRTTATVSDIEFDPFDDQIIASAADDGKISVWEIPQDYSFHHYVDDTDAIKDITQPKKVLTGHKRKVGHLKFNPVAKDVLASSSTDYSIKVWNVATGEVVQTLQHKDAIQSFDWNYNGTLIASTSRDKTIRIWNARTGELLNEGPGHTGAKASRVVWLGQTDRIATTGFSKLSDRQIGVWDTTDIKAGSIGGFYTIDLSAGIVIPLYDECTKMLYLAGKGDGNIRYFEFENDELYQLSEYQSTDPQRGFALAPKRSVNVHENEVLKTYKACGNDTYIEPISFICPRRGDYFQDDIYPDCPSGKAALKAEEWVSGKDVNGPILVEMADLYNGSTPTLKEADAPAAAAATPAAAPAEPKKEEKPKEVVKEEPKAATPPVVTPPSRAGSNVDGLLKSSSEVNSMLSKVNDLSDDEKPVEDGADDDDEWKVETKEVKPEPKKEPESKPVAKEDPVASPKKPEEPVATPKKEEEPSAPPKKEEEPSAPPKKEETPVKSVVASEPAPATSKVAGAASGLKQHVEKLQASVSSLEALITKLVDAGLDKDERIKSLEDKIDQLLKK